MSDQTWVKIYRKMTEWEWYSHPPTRDLFFHLLLTVNHKPSRYMGHDIPAGAAVYGRKELAVLLGFSEKNVRTALDHLKSTNEVAIKTTNKFSIIQIVKWDDYQSQASTSANNRPTIGQQLATDKELKNIRYKDIYTGSLDGFPEFWRHYPKQRAGSKDKALAAWTKACKRHSAELVLTGCKAYAASDEVAKGFAKGCAAWLNDERYLNDYSTSGKKPVDRSNESENLKLFMGG